MVRRSHHQSVLAAYEKSQAVCVTKMFYSKTTGLETWITSDGQAYLVQLESGGEDLARGSFSNASQASERVSITCLYARQLSDLKRSP